jgi:hypothetical protein
MPLLLQAPQPPLRPTLPLPQPTPPLLLARLLLTLPLPLVRLLLTPPLPLVRLLLMLQQLPLATLLPPRLTQPLLQPTQPLRPSTLQRRLLQKKRSNFSTLRTKKELARALFFVRRNDFRERRSALAVEQLAVFGVGRCLRARYQAAFDQVQ